MMRAAGVVQNPREVAAAQAAQARGAADAARAQAQAARDQAQAARDQAKAAADQARASGESGQPAGEPVRTVTIETADGRTISLENPSNDALSAALGVPMDNGSRDPGPYIVGAIAIVSTAIVILVGITLWYRARVRGTSAPAAALSNEVQQRLSRMEAGIESVAVEVERISEGQRFTTRLLADRERVEVPRG